MANPNLQLLTDAAKLLKPILKELVFVGGCATALLITDTAAADVRPHRASSRAEVLLNDVEEHGGDCKSAVDLRDIGVRDDLERNESQHASDYDSLNDV